MSYDRQRAVALKAADAKALLRSSLPFVFNVMTPAQIAQVQKVLDAAVVNPDIKKQADDIYRNSVKAQSGNVVIRDENMVKRAYRVNATMIEVAEQDKHVRIDFNRLLTAGALSSVTDNPDEAAFLQAVRNTLNTKGVWLRFDRKLVRDPDDYGVWIADPRSLRVWLSLGHSGDEIPTKDGRIDRETLLGTTLLGAGYFEAVHHGPVQSALNKQIEQLRTQINGGISEHNSLKMRKLDFPIVGRVSDTLGGADLPDISIWDYPSKLLRKAVELNGKGNVSRSLPYLIVAAIITRNNAKLLAQYIEDSNAGAGRAVKVLKVAKEAGEIAEVVLVVTGVVGLVRGSVRVVGGAAARDAATDAAADRFLVKTFGKDAEIMADCGNKNLWAPGPKGTKLRGVKPGGSPRKYTQWDY